LKDGFSRVKGMFPNWKLYITIWKLCQVSFENGASRKRENRYLNLVLWIGPASRENYL
jgi:hypothetical protein